MAKLHIAPNLTLPLQAVTETFTVLGKRGTGKTYTAGVVVEELLKAGQQLVIIDPTDVWWGLRSSADGKSPGLPVVIFGGPHGDLPLTEHDAPIIARAIIEQGFSCVLSMRHLSKGARLRFAAVLFEDLYHLKAERRDPLMLVIDEADRFAPQKLMKGQNQERTLGAVDEIVRMGRSSGFGVMLLTQRSAVISKDVISQTEVLICTRTVSPQDLAAVDAWISEHDVEDKRDEFMASLPSLPIGDAWWWSPGWLEVFKLTRVRPKETFDSSYTPRAGEKPRKPKRVADVDLAALKTQLAQQIEKAVADDPKRLRAELATLRKELATEQAKRVSLVKEPRVVVDKAVMQTAKAAGARDGRQRLARDAMRLITPIEARIESILKVQLSDVLAWQTKTFQAVQPLTQMLQGVIDEPEPPREYAAAATPVQAIQMRAAGFESPPLIVKPPPAARRRRLSDDVERTIPTSSDGAVTGVQQKILNTIAGFVALGVTQPDREVVAAMSGYHIRTKSFVNAIGALRTSGLVEYPTAGTVVLTSDGDAIAQNEFSFRSLSELHDQWYKRLTGTAAKILKALIEADARTTSPGTPIEREWLASALGYHTRTKTFVNSIGRLRTLGLIDYPTPGTVGVTDVLFPPGL